MVTKVELERQWHTSSWTKESFGKMHKDEEGKPIDPSGWLPKSTICEAASGEEYEVFKAIEGVPGYWKSKVTSMLLSVHDTARDEGKRPVLNGSGAVLSPKDLNWPH